MVARLRPCGGNARTHSKKQVRQIADSINRFGFTKPVLISDDGEIIACGCSERRLRRPGSSPGAALAIDYLVYRVGLHSGMLAAALGGLDAFVFTAGVGEYGCGSRTRPLGPRN
jgi:hypothetical protein